jgi:streptogramin lyase
MKRYGLVWTRLTTVIGLALVSLLGLLSFSRSPQVAAQTTRGTSSATRAAYLYRYDQVSQSFFTIPLASTALPIGVAVTGTNPTQVWIADYGLNQVTRVVFTSTANYAQTAYPITTTTNSGPYRIAVHGNDVWFTERGGNRVGRLNAVTGQIDEFYAHGLSPNAGLSDIKVAPDNTVWIGGQTAQRLIQLTVNSSSVYTFMEYADTNRPNFVVAPAFLAIGENSQIWLTAPAVNDHPIAKFTPSTQAFVWPTLPIGSQPEDVVAVGGYAWTADRLRNTIDQVQYGTFSLVNSFGPITSPMEIAAESPNIFWTSEDDGQGAIARFVYTSVVSFQVSSRALPVPGLQLAGLDVAPDRGVWVAAYSPVRVYLPIVLRNP